MPACVVALGDGVGRGSGRSCPGIDLGSAVIAAKQHGLLINGGGHPMAAGFTVAADRVSALRDFLVGRLAASIRPDLVVPTMDLDGALQVGGASIDLATLVEQIGPFGSGNPRPRFALSAARVINAEIAGTDHVRCLLTDASGVARLPAIAFRVATTPLGRALCSTGGMPLHVAGSLTCDRWQGRTRARFEIEDAAPATLP
jgi:single-stranded-DNA-specific exonuclease